MAIFNDLLQFFIAPLFVVGVTGLVTLIYRDNRARKKLVQDVKDDLEDFKKYLIGDPKYANDHGVLGDIRDAIQKNTEQLETVLRQTK